MALKDATKDAATGNLKGAIFTAITAAIVYVAIRGYEKAKS